MQTVGAQIERQRKSLRMSREKLAARMGEGWSSSTIKRVEKDDAKVSPEAVEATAKAVGLVYDRDRNTIVAATKQAGESVPQRLDRVVAEIAAIAHVLRDPSVQRMSNSGTLDAPDTTGRRRP